MYFLNRLGVRCALFGSAFLFFLFIAWFSLVPSVLKAVVRSKTGCELIFRESSLQGKSFVLKDALLRDLAHDRFLRIREARVTYGFFGIQISLLQPHLVVCEGIDPVHLQSSSSSSPKLPFTIEVIDGTYEWGKTEPFSGRFSFSQNKGLVVDGDGGSLRAYKTEKGEVACSLERWNMVQFLNQKVCSNLRGAVSGDLLISPRGVSGQLRVEDLSFVLAESAVKMGASSVEWRSVGSIDRGKVFVQDAFVAYEENKIDQLSGSFSYSRKSGISWKLLSDAFFCEGSYDFGNGEWKANSSGTDFVCQGKGWDFDFRKFELALTGRGWERDQCSATFSLQGIEGMIGKVPFSGLQAEGQVVEGVFSSTSLKGLLSGIHLRGSIEGSLSNPKALLRLSGAVPHLECEGSLLVQADLLQKAVEVEIDFSRFLIRKDDAMISFSQLEGARASFEEKASWSFEIALGKGECLLRGKKVFFEGAFSLDSSLLVYEGNSWLDQVESRGKWMFSLLEGIPFSFQAEYLEGDINLFSGAGHLRSQDFLMNGALLDDPVHWIWKMEADVSRVEWSSFSKGAATICADSQYGVTSCRNLTGIFQIGSFRLPLRGVDLSRCKEKWFFDLRVEDRWCDLLRFKGEMEKEGDSFALRFDPEGTRLLDVPIAIQKCILSSQGSLESLGMDFQIPWKTLVTLIPQLDLAHEFAFDRASLVNTSLSLHKADEGWEISFFRFGLLEASGKLSMRENLWTVEKGVLTRGEGDYFAFSGSFDFSFGEFLIEKMSVDLQHLFFPFLLEGKVEGSGSLEWNGGLALEGDFLLRPSHVKSGEWVFENESEIQLHCSRKQGLLLQGIDFTLGRAEDPCLQGRIGLLQFNFDESRWLFHHTQLHAPTDAFQNLLSLIPECSPVSFIFNVLSPRRDLDFSASFDFAANGSSFSCYLFDGSIPIFDEVRYVKNVELQWNGRRLLTSFELHHLDRSFNGGMSVEVKGSPRGRVFLDSLNVEWEMDSKEGLIIYSIDGSFGGVEASFYKEAESKSLLGSLRCQFDLCADFLPSEVAKAVRILKMGKGYELKGKFSYEDGYSFNGVLSGKSCDLLGYQIRTLFTRVQLDANQLCFSEMNISDPAGVLNIDSLVIGREAVKMPRFWLRDFRPSLLQKPGRSENMIAPFVIRDLKVQDLKGKLNDSSSYTAKGELSFVNSFKQGRTVLDLPADLLGRIVGLDLELLIPVQGTFQLELKDRRFWLSDLQDSWSDGKRSKFFLVDEGLSPSIDLDGNLNILVKMKQYVLFKITENFLLSIEGNLEKPDYHLQKKKKSLG